MPFFNLWAPEFELKPSPLACGVSILLTLFALSSLLLLPLRNLWVILLAGVILAVTIQKILQQVFLVGDDAIVRVYYRDSGWWLETRKGFELPVTLRPDSVVSQWFILLNFNMGNMGNMGNMDNLDNQKRNEDNRFKVKNTAGSRAFPRLKKFIRGRKKSVLILPDGLLTSANIGENGDDFRRLRVFLRFGKGIG